MGTLTDFKIEVHNFQFTPATGSKILLNYGQSYSAIPNITATSISNDNVNAYVSDIKIDQAYINISAVPTKTIVVSIHIIGT